MKTLQPKSKPTKKKNKDPALGTPLPKPEFTMINRKYHNDAMLKPYKKDMDKLAHASEKT